MKDVTRVEVLAVQHHLDAHGTGVALPWPLPECAAFHVHLEPDDVSKIVLWFEFEKYTKDSTCNLTDALPAAADDKRTKSFIAGDSLGRKPIDLGQAKGFEPVMVTEELKSDLLYVIDGSHRLLAQQLSHRGFDGVGAFVCLHPQALHWAYIPVYHKTRLFT
jgi:hypothetical protein